MVTILVENQIIEVKWHNPTKHWYEEKGYKFTKKGDVFKCKAEDLTRSSNIKVKCICDYCGKIVEIRYEHYLSQTENGTLKYACSNCVKHKKRDLYILGKYSDHSRLMYTPEEVKQIVESKNGNVLLNSEEYQGFEVKNLRIICGSCGEEFVSTLANIKATDGRCRKCGRIEAGKNRKFSVEHVKNYIESINNNKYLNPEEYKDSTTNNLRIKCGLCGKEYVTHFYSYKSLNQTCCPDCARKTAAENRKHDPEYVKNIIESQNGNIWLNPDGYTGCTDINLKVRCGECGDVYTTSLVNYIRGQIRCKKCSLRMSMGEKIIQDVLIKYNIPYTYEKKFADCKDKRELPFDFYLPSYNTCIEFDGQQHYEPSYGQESFEKTQLHDKMKNEYCEEKGINLIRIPYWEGSKIEQILKDELHI